MHVLAPVTLALALAQGLQRRTRPRRARTQKLPGLSAAVEVVRDRWGVPHIYAASEADLWFAQGYVHAEDRLWQMEMNRRMGQGRLAEILGAKAFEIDRLLRIVGFGRAAAADLAAMDPADAAALASYGRGVNAYLATGRLPLELRLLRHRPAPWRPVDTLAWGKVMAWSLSINWTSEILHAAIIDRLGPEKAAALQCDYPTQNPSIMHAEETGQMLTHVLAQFQAAERWLPVGGLAGMSNNWVVDGAKSSSGRPLLANDPHLTAFIPSTWYENHLVCPELEVAGVSMPGAPGVILGHNAHIAWGATAAFPDTQDLYLEKFDPHDPTLYEFEGAWERASVAHEEIWVRGEQQPRTVDVTVTRHGPVINEMCPLASGPAVALALRWTGYEANALPRGILALNRASDWATFGAALADWHEPALNFVYADTEGNIGYHMAGRVPQRSQGLGLVPVPGWTGGDEWTGWIPHEALPQALNPAQHYFASANNQITGREYPHFLSLETANGFRAARIVELLTAQERLSPADFAAMQIDLSSEASAAPLCRLLAEISPAILADPALVAMGRQARAALDLLTGWDYNLTAESAAGGIFQTLRYFAMRRVFEPWLGDLTDHFLGVGFDLLLAPVIFSYLDRTPLVLERILVQNESHWLVDSGGAPAGRATVLARALADTITYLQQRLGPNPTGWRWGALHQVQFTHLLGRRGVLGRIFNRGPYPYGGDHNTVWQGGYMPRLPIRPQESVTASWRQIIDVGDWDASLGVLPTGQSGHPGSPHYDDMTPLWLAGAYHPLPWTRARVEAEAEARTWLAPDLAP